MDDTPNGFDVFLWALILLLLLLACIFMLYFVPVIFGVPVPVHYIGGAVSVKRQ